MNEDECGSIIKCNTFPCVPLDNVVILVFY